MITEPMTMFTDYMLATQAAVYAWRWRERAARGGGAAARLFLVGLLTIVVAASAGGTSHGFRGPLGDWWGPVWTLTLWSIGASVVLVTAAALRASGGAHAASVADRRDGRRWLGVGFVVTAIGVSLMVARVSLHQHFNHNDIFHLVQMGGLWAVERGLALLVAPRARG
jgi:hypothetical protein